VLNIEVNTIYNEDCLIKLKELPENSIDSIVTDPPYELGFMGKSWDSTGIAYNVDVWKECLRVLKPGGYLLAFGGTRTYHRMACAIEDAGFEIRDQIQWIYGSGFPKSLNISKAITAKELTGGSSPQNLRQVGMKENYKPIGQVDYRKGKMFDSNTELDNYETELTENATEWNGWGTALKPANEPICMARKPLSEKTVAENVLKWGTGGINIDGCRIYRDVNDTSGWSITGSKESENIAMSGKNYARLPKEDNSQGRFPANIIFDEEAGKMLDEQSGKLKSGSNCVRSKEGSFIEHGGLGKAGDVQITYGDTGGASRFFYCAKASKSERGEGNTHPTVKPLKLMEYLVRLVTPPNGIVLDPFAGSGTTLLAAQNEGFNYIGIEKEKAHCDIINKRINGNNKQTNT
jgi:site-specific DNA-methyltransferase (adenine-specific)